MKKITIEIIERNADGTFRANPTIDNISAEDFIPVETLKAYAEEYELDTQAKDEDGDIVEFYEYED